MSSLDRIKKKREQLLVENNKSYSSTDKSMQRISSLRNELSTTGKIDYGDIAPINFDNTSTKEEEKKKSWFNTSAFDDGYDFGDISKTILGTYKDIKQDVTKGLLGIGEGLVDTGAYLVGGAADIFGNKDFADSTKKFIARDFVEESKLGTLSANLSSMSDMASILGKNLLNKDKGFISGVKEDLFNEEFEDSSILGDKSDSLVQSGGQLAGTIALQGVGVPWFVTTGVASFGGGVEEAFMNDASYLEAGVYGGISAGAEILTEKLSGGISFGGKTLDDALLKPLTNKISNKVANTLLKFGIDAVGEGGEEVLTEVITNVGKKLTFEDEKTWGELLTSEEAMNNYLDAFIGGAVLGGGFNVGKAASSIKTGRDYDTGLTANEQKVVDSEVKKRTDGKNLTKKQIAKIETEVKNELEKGYISTDTIESVLGGDTYNNLKSTRDNKTKIENEIKALEGKKNAEITVKEMEHLKDLREQLKGIDTNTLETDLQGKMGQIIKSDGYLQRSYQEKAKRGQKFTYDASKVTNEFEKAALESASKVMNDTNRSHEFVEPVVKLAKDKGTYYEFTNNAELEKSNYDVKGRQVNGLVTVEKDGKKKILINVDSTKALNTIVGHETTHLLEGTTEYKELQDAIFNYAKTKGDFDSRQASLYSLYKDIKGADVNSELTADLVGDYLFTDNNFISELSTQKPTVFQKIKELIDDLVVRFKGTKEEKALREVQKKFKEAYRQQTDTQSDTKTDTQYSLTDNQGRTLTKEQQEYFKDSKVRDENGNLKEVYHWTPNEFTTFDKDMIGSSNSSTYLEGFYFSNKPPQSNKGKVMSVYLDIKNPMIFDMDKSPYTVVETQELIDNFRRGETTPVYEYLIEYEGYSEQQADEIIDEWENADGVILKNTSYDIHSEEYIVFEPNQIKNIDNTNPTTDADIRYSLSEVDNQGRELTEYTLEKTKNSKVRDENGKLMLMYHGSPNGTYDQLRAGTYFTSRKEYADGYQWEGASSISYGKQVNNPRTYEAYLNITNPFTLKNETAKHIYLNEYIKGGNSAYFDPYTDYTDTINNMDEIDWVEGEDLKEWLQENHPEFDGLFLDEGGDGGYGMAEYRWRGISVIPFSEEQIIKANNNNTEYSLSNQNEIAPRNPNLTYGEDVKLQVEETIAPLQEEIQTLTETVNELKEQLAPIQVRDEYAPLTEEDLPYLEQQYNEAPKEDIAPPETEENIPVAEDEITPTKSLFETRNYEEVGSRKVNAYQYDNPEVKPYFQEAARSMIDDLAYSLKGQRFYNDQVYYDTNGEQGFFGINRFTANDIAELLDGVDGKYKLSYKDLEKGLKAIIEDKGAENNAASKRIEFYLDKRLREGFTTLDGVEIPANQEYLDLLETKEMNDYYSNIPIGEAPVENVGNPVGNVSNTKVSESNVPIKEMNTNDSGQGVLDLGTLNKLKAPEGEIKNKYAEPIDKNTAKQLTIEGKEEDLVTKTKKELRKALLGTEAQKEFITNALDNAKNRSMALMNNTDTIRNTELVFGRDAGNVINEVIFQKEIDNEADSIAWQNKERQEIKDLGIKARSKESAAVQKYGEKQYVNEYNEVVAYGDVELAKEFSDVATQEKIKNAAKVIRSKYDAYIDNANNVLTKLGFEPIKKRNDYMRHFQELNDVFTRYGIPFNAQNMQEHTLPTDINGLTEFWSPQKNYFANMQPRKGMKTTYDAITGIDGYIGGIANLIYHTEDIQRGRAFEELIRETYGEDKGWDNLENLPEELQQARMEKIQDNHLSNYAAWVHEWTNNVAGKKNKIDRSVEAMFGRKAFAVLDEVRKQVGSNMIGLNLSSSLTNLIAPVQAASKTNKLAVLKGTADTIKNMFVKDNFMDNNKFLTARMGTDMLSQNAWQKMQNAGFVFMKGMDWFSSNQIVRSKYYELRAKGMSEAQAHSEAGKFAARILGDRTKGANAQLYNSKLVGLVTQFQLEVNNQLYSQFYDTYHESKEAAQGNALKTAAGMTFTLGQLFALTHLFGQTFEAIAGYNPTFDVVEMIKTAFGWGDDEEEEEKPLSERLKAAADQLVDALPYVNILTGGGRIPVASGIPNLVGVATGGKDQYGNELTLEDEMKKLLYLIPPTGGNQFKKTTQGLSMFDEDLPVTGSYTDSGNLRFPVEDTFGNRVQAAVFGQWASENARNYFDNERQPLKEKQIQEYADLDMPIKDYWKYREGLKEQSTIEEKFEYINGLDVTDEQKNIMINNATGREIPIDMSGYDNFGSYDEFDYATKNPDKYKVIEQIDTFDNFNSYKEDIKSIKEQFSEDNGYSTKDRKVAVQQYINSLSLDIPQKIMLEKMAGGYSIKDYENYMFSYIQSLPMTAEEKQAMHKQLFD